jgi:hypothetical protein
MMASFFSRPLYSCGQMKATTKLTFYVIFKYFGVADDVNLKNSFLCYLLGDDFSGDLLFNSDLQ